MFVLYDDWSRLLGKSVKIHGRIAVVLGLDRNAVRSIGPAKSVAPWLVEFPDGAKRQIVPGQEQVDEVAEVGYFVD